MNMQKCTKIYLCLLIVGLLTGYFSHIALGVYQGKYLVENYGSRIVMESAMDFIRKEKPTPPVTAIFYAKVAENIYNGRTTDYRNTLDEILLEESQLPNVPLKWGNDKNEYWVERNGIKPFSPKISGYPRFNLENFEYITPAPPSYMSEEFKAELNKVIDAAGNRTLEQGSIVNFYGGIPGSEQPSGIWLNIYYDYVNKYNQNLKNKLLGKQISEEGYKYQQMLLAQALADAFMECWEVKYKYQTKRPDMAAKTLGRGINLAMANPPFPSYVSGHATISFAAATVLTKMFPENGDSFLQQAENAKNSRLWGGIHFDYDNVEGKNLGIKIGEYYIEKVLKF